MPKGVENVQAKLEDLCDYLGFNTFKAIYDGSKRA